MMSSHAEFNNRQLEQLDRIENLAFDLLEALADGVTPDEKIVLRWDMGKIGEVIDTAVDVLAKHGIRSYYPYRTEKSDGTEEICDYEFPPEEPNNPYNIPETYTKFKSDEEKTAFLQKYGLLGTSGKKRKPFVYKGMDVSEPTPCEVVGYLGEYADEDDPDIKRAVLVLSTHGILSAVDSLVFRDMQHTSYKCAEKNIVHLC